MAAHRGLTVNMSRAGGPESLESAGVNAAIFGILGVAPLLGRTMTIDKDSPGAAGTVVFSYGFWQRRFGGDASILRMKLLFDGQPHLVIGVMPRDFYYPRREAQIWTAMRFDKDDFADRGGGFLSVIARLNKGVSLSQARAELKSVGVNLERQYPKENARSGVSVLRLRDEVSSRTRMLVQVLVAAALFVLSIAVANLTNLFLARAATRRNEIAVRLALGASRARLVRQLLTESLLLTGAGGLLGAALAIMAVPILARMVPSSLPIAMTPGVDWRLWTCAVAATVLTAVACGIPALRAIGGGLGLRASTGVRRDAVRRSLVVAQVAAPIALVVSTGLLARALLQVESANPGFATGNRLIFRTSLPMPKYFSTAARERFYATVLEELRAVPGVTAVAAVSYRPMGDSPGGIWMDRITARFVTPGYFTAMRIPLLRGRDVNDSDGPKSLRVAVVSESFIQQHGPGESGIGKSFSVPFATMQLTIVGVVADIRFRGMEHKSEPQMYFAHAQCADAAFIWFTPRDFVVAISGDPMALMPSVS